MSKATRTRRSRARVLIGLVVTAMTLALAACGSSASGSKSSGSGGGSWTKITYAPDQAAVAPGAGVPAAIPTLDQLFAGTESAPPATGPKAAKGKFVIWVSCGELSAGCSEPSAAARDAAKALGWRFGITDAKFNTAGGFATAIRQAVAQKPDGIILYAYDCSLAQQALTEAKAAKVAIVGMLVHDCSEGANPGPSLFSASPIYSPTAKTTDEYWGSYGAAQAAYVIDKTQGKAKVIVLDETDAVPAQFPATVAMLKKCPGCSVVDVIKVTGPDFTPGGPMAQEFKTAIQRHPDANAIILNFDSAMFTAGLSEAFATTPQVKNMVVVAGEGAADAMALLKKPGSFHTADAAYDTAWHAWAGMDAMNRIFQNAPQAPEGIGVRLVDAQHNPNASQSGPYQSPIDFKSAYEKVWSGS